jgi:hypothetical protein
MKKELIPNIWNQLFFSIVTGVVAARRGCGGGEFCINLSNGQYIAFNGQINADIG